ncbi:glutathionylspermidine synthase family protein [Enterobacter cloacae]|uniref:glutathionylspermidine synthase family protein n=1 Tax=Enterobacter cloacae TaxID=550 RepID=UPI001AC03188|nr:glutathionylspermidine synthase family protein [Enterobacter cloacae]MCU6414157.1 glutathionylspermidine synthase family protein [Enterobacter cloacae]HAZ4815793.1 glutathionylspermidine synthase family protein [Enterobacter cloacae]
MQDLTDSLWQDFCATHGTRISALDTQQFKEKTLIRGRKYYYPPTILSQQFRDEIEAISLEICSAVLSIPERLFNNDYPAWINYLGYDDYEAHLLKNIINKKFLTRAVLFMRPDFILTQSGPKLCEVNVAATIGGMTGNVNYLDTFRQTRLAEHIAGRNHEIGYDLPEEHWISAIKQSLHNTGTKKSPVLFEATASALDKSPMRKLFQQMAEKAGFTVVSGIIHEIDIREDGVYIDDFKVDVVYTRFTWDEIKRYVSFEQIQSLCMADNKGLIDFISPPLYTLFDNKLNLALLSTEAGRSLSPAIAHVLPETIKIDAESASLLIESKDDWVIKPTTEYGGKGIIIGSEVALSAWENQIKEILKEKKVYIAQKKITATLSFNDSDTGSYTLSVGGMVFNHNFAGIFLRRLHNTSPSMVINATQGAECAPGVYIRMEQM